MNPAIAPQSVDLQLMVRLAISRGTEVTYQLEVHSLGIVLKGNEQTINC